MHYWKLDVAVVGNFFFFYLINYELKQQKRRKKYRYNKKLERTDTPIRLMDSRVYIVLTM